MQHIHSFELEDTLLFKKIKFEIPKGLSVIYGLNRTNAKNSMQANGAGKSSAFAAIGEILYEEPIVGLKEDTVKQGTRKVRLQIGKRRVDVERRNTKLEIKVDGKPKKFRKINDGRAWLRKHLPMSQTEYNTYGFLDARVPHPLVMGSSTERKKFFTEAFGLDRIDVERRLFEAELSKLKRVRAAYVELKAVFMAEKAQALSKEDRLALEAKAAEYEAQVKELNAKNTRLQSIGQLLAFEASAAKQVVAFNALVQNLAEFSSIYGEVESNLKDNKSKLRDARAWADYQRDSRKYGKAFADLSKDAQKLIDRKGLKGAIKRCRSAVEELDELQAKADRLQKVIDREVREPKAPKAERPGSSKKEVRAKLESYEHQLEHAEKFGSGKCGSCGQDVKVVDATKLRKRVKALTAELEAFDAYSDYDEELALYREHRKALKAAKGEWPDIEEQSLRLRRYKKIGKELRDLPDAPEPFEGRKLEIEVCERMVEEDRAQLELLDFMQPNLDTVESLRALTDKQRNAARLAPKLQDRITEIHEKLSRVRAKLEVNSSVTATLKKHKARLLEMKEELADEESLKLLVEAYSDKAMKRTAIKAVSTRLMAEVNKYAKLIFPEDYEFGFSWDSSKLSLTVTRKYRQGKKVKILSSDVRKLSGAESKLYTFILVLAHLTFVPSRKRSNVLILDEPDSNMSAETTEAFKKLLPILNQVIPSIIVITPRTAERYEGAQEFTVLKEKGEARIVAGHPKSIK